MKDYIDKLREDYHRKQIKKLKFGDKFMAKINDIRYGKMSAPEQEVDENGEPVSKGPGPSLTALKGPNATLGKDVKPSLFTNSQMGLGNQNKDVIYSPGYEKTGKEIEKNQEDLKNIFTNPGQESTYDGKIAPSFIKEGEKKQTKPPEQQPPGFFLPPNGDLTTNLYNLGRAIGQKKGTPGRGFGIVGNAGAATLEATRSLLSGVGFSKAQAYTDQFNQEQMIAARKKYESNPQYSNANYIGGPTESRDGGKIRVFAEGGEQMDPRQAQMMQMMQQQQGQQEADPRQQQMDPRQAQMMQQQGQQPMDPRQAQQQETQMTEQESAAYQQIAEKLVNSFETIEEIANYLKENRVDQVAYQAILNFAQDMIEDRDESKQENDEATEEPQNEEEGGGSEEMRKGGKKFNKKVGEYIEFEYDGKVHKGTIKSIKNGQIFLK
jgi:hypothetical protein